VVVNGGKPQALGLLPVTASFNGGKGGQGQSNAAPASAKGH
jgi:hypothetical protein